MATAVAALETMGFEDMSNPPEGELVEYWLPFAPSSVVVLHDHELAEQRHTLAAVIRQLDTEQQRQTFRELTGW